MLDEDYIPAGKHKDYVGCLGLSLNCSVCTNIVYAIHCRENPPDDATNNYATFVKGLESHAAFINQSSCALHGGNKCGKCIISQRCGHYMSAELYFMIYTSTTSTCSNESNHSISYMLDGFQPTTVVDILSQLQNSPIDFCQYMLEHYFYYPINDYEAKILATVLGKLNGQCVGKPKQTSAKPSLKQSKKELAIALSTNVLPVTTARTPISWTLYETTDPHCPDLDEEENDEENDEEDDEEENNDEENNDEEDEEDEEEKKRSLMLSFSTQNVWVCPDNCKRMHPEIKDEEAHSYHDEYEVTPEDVFCVAIHSRLVSVRKGKREEIGVRISYIESRNMEITPPPIMKKTFTKLPHFPEVSQLPDAQQEKIKELINYCNCTLGCFS